MTRADDIILATQPKCGTTWIKALAFTITNRSRYGFDDHPLLTRHPQHVVPFIEIVGGVGANRPDIHALPSQRLLATHISTCRCRWSTTSHEPTTTRIQNRATRE
ncbi:hypothetical protein ZWY2020_023412 [Hordeum vulgare]|nr:hypothetical protein ZWY2020_023412 [Hordeum vulgare]